jgi:probable addiction module antidote protein
MERSKMTETALPYDSAEYLKDPETMRLYMDEAFATGDPALISHALGAVARARSMADIARKTGLSRESLYRALSADGRPELATIMKVLGALDLTLRATQTEPAAKKRRVSKDVQRDTKKKTTRRKDVTAGRRIHA